MIYDQDPELYDLQYQAYRDDIPFYLRLADEAGSPILELGCGTGRVTEALVRAGHAVVGVDSSEAMLGLARAKLAPGLAAGAVELRAADMRELALGRQFRLVIAPFNTLMHAYTLADQDRTLESVRAHLAPGGIFALDLFTPRFGAMGVLRQEAEWLDVGGARSELFLVQDHDADNQLITSRYLLDRADPDGTVRRSVTSLTQRYFHRFELERVLRAAGFSDLAIFGSFDRARYTAQSANMVAVARLDG